MRGILIVAFVGLLVSQTAEAQEDNGTTVVLNTAGAYASLTPALPVNFFF